MCVKINVIYLLPSYVITREIILYHKIQHFIDLTFHIIVFKNSDNMGESLPGSIIITRL